MKMKRYKRYPAYKDSGVEWLGEIPTGWEVRRLRATIQSCQNGVWGEEPDGVNDIACIRVADFDRISLKVDISDPTSRAVESKVLAARALHPGNLLIEKSGGGEQQPVGSVVLYDHKMQATCSNFVARIAVSPGYSSRYLTYLHATLYAGRLNTRHIKQSTGIQNLDSSSYFSEAVGLPSEPEQRKIAAFLDHKTLQIDALKKSKERLVELIKEKRSALINELVTKGLNSESKLRDSGIDYLGMIPSHWEIKPLKYLFINLDHKRIPISGEERATKAKIYPYYGASGIIDYTENYIFEEPLILVAEDGANLYSRSTPLAFVATGKYWVNNHAHILRPIDGLVEYWANVLGRIVFDPWITGSAQPKLTSEKLGSIPLPVPPEKEREVINEHLNAIGSQLDLSIGKIGKAIKLLTEYRSALISAAVTGKIDVRETSVAEII